MVKAHISLKSVDRGLENAKNVVRPFLDELEVGVGINYKNLNIYPIYRSKAVKTNVVSLKEALTMGIVEIKETGTVNHVKVKNKSDKAKILLVEGATIKGGAQNRVINTTIIVLPNTEIDVPTSCVQQHRWDTFDAPFTESSYVSPSVHSALCCSVTDNIISCNQKTVDADCMHIGSTMSAVYLYASNQGTLWQSVSDTLTNSSSSNSTDDIHAIYKSNKSSIDEWMKKFELILSNNSIIGVVAEINNKIFANISDTTEFAKQSLKAIIEGYCLEALTCTSLAISLNEEKIINFLNTIDEGKFIVGNSPNNVGKDVRIKKENSLATIFCFDNKVVHISVTTT